MLGSPVMNASGEVVETCWACGAPAHPVDAFLPARYNRCEVCGLHFQPQRTADELRELYDEAYFEQYAGGGDYARESAQRRHEARVRVRFLRRFAVTGRLLEVGAANGHFLDEARRAGYTPLGIEPVAEFADRARRAFGVEIVAGFLEDVALAAQEFDVACAFHVLEHLATPLDALERMRAALRRGGTLFVEVPNIESVAARRDGAGWGALEPLHHVAHYGPRSLRAMLERAGFDVDYTDTVPFFSYLRPAAASLPRHLAHRLVLSARGRVSLRGPHPERHELLRAVARARD